MTLIRWTLTDTVTSATYTFPINPNVMATPFNAKQLTTSGIGIGGQIVTQRTTPEPFEWTFGGHSRGKAMYDNLVAWMGCKHVCTLTDHLARSFSILPSGITFTERRSAIEAWRFTYEAKALMLGQYGGGIW